MNWFQFPLIKIALWFVGGILFATKIQMPIPVFITAISFCVISSVILLHISSSTLQKTLFGFTLYGFAFAIGSTTHYIHTDTNDRAHYLYAITDNEQILHLTLRERLKPSQYADRYVAVVNQIDHKPTFGKILINLSASKDNRIFHIGSQLRVQGTISKHKAPRNPSQFDYGRYLTNKAIAAQLYTDVQSVKVNPKSAHDIWFYADRLRTNIISNLKGHIKPNELAVLNALILGQQQDISSDTLKDFQYAGAVHILSVSGLHVGFLLIFLNLLLKPLPNHSKGRVLKFFIIVTFLWLFAVLAGLSPSVVRSVTMFSFVALGMCIRRGTNIFHTLVISIILILLFEPSFLFDVGFQLSYIALFFILWLQPALSALWTPKYKVVKYFWDIITVSVAAQVGALPLSIYYFHQFPGLFFVTNLLVIPFITIIMALGCLIMIMAALNYVPTSPAKTLEYAIYSMNEIIHFVASFESFIIQDIPLNMYLLLCFYLLIISTIIWYTKPSFNKLVFVGCSIITVQMAYLITLYEIQKQSELIVFHEKENTLLTVRNGQEINAYVSKSDTKVAHSLQAYTTAQFSRLSQQKALRNTISFGKKRLLLIDSSGTYPRRNNPDILILTQSPKMNLDRLLAKFRPEIVIADGSNYKSYAKRWEQTCSKQKIPFHFTSEKGFYIIKK